MVNFSTSTGSYNKRSWNALPDWAPEKPKRPPSAWSLFLQENHAVVKKQYPNKKMTGMLWLLYLLISKNINFEILYLLHFLKIFSINFNISKIGSVFEI